MLLSDGQWEKALCPIRVTLLGILTSVSFLQFRNTQFSMLVIPLPIFTCAKLVHLKNAARLRLVTLSGISMLVMEEQPAKANSPMLLILLPSVMILSDVQPLNA